MGKGKLLLEMGIISLMGFVSIIQYNHDKDRVLHEYNKFTFMMSKSMRINESSTAKKYYVLSHRQNVLAAKEFAKKNIFHYTNLFKTGVDEDITRAAARRTFRTALDAWVKIDPDYRLEIYVYGRTLNVDYGSSVPEFLLTVENRPSLYGEYYYDGQYQNQSDYVDKPGDNLQQYIDDKAYDDKASIVDDLKSSSSEPDDSYTSSSHESKQAKKMQKIDNNFHSTVSIISNKFSDEEGVPYHAGGQAVPKAPSEYKKMPKTFTVTFSTSQPDIETIYTVKLELDKKDYSFVIINQQDLPDYISELGK